MSIHPIFLKIKALTLKVGFEGFIMILIIILVGLAGFGLGRLSTAGETNPIIIQTGESATPQFPISNSAPQTLTGAENSSSGNIVASKNGTKYYFSWCSGVGRIQDQNKVYFTTEQEAIDAGYSKASGCDK
jgi:hypothetical protein